MSNFVHLHLHSEYSLLDGTCRLDDIFKKARALNMPAVAITDHGNMYGAMDFYLKGLKYGIKPIIGCEIYVAPRTINDRVPRLDDSLNHLVLLVKNELGYRNLIKLLSIAYLDGFYYKPRVDKEILREYSDGLIALSACLAGKVASCLMEGKKEEACQQIYHYKEIFGEGNFYLELQDHGIPEQKEINPFLIELAKETGVELVATNDVHYLNKEDADAHDILLCIQTGKTINDQDRLQFKSKEFYFKSEEEMLSLFPQAPESISNTVNIAEKCNFFLDRSNVHLPYFKVEEGQTIESYLRQLCYHGAKERYGEITDKIKERLDYELEVIISKGYAAYFLIVWDFIKFARSRSIPVGPGRGSAAGSLVAYCLKITNMDPLLYGLIFERFLNPERKSMPDIDVDICFERRDEVIEYVTEKYGRDNVSQIITFGTMAARSAIRDVGRVLGIPLPEVDKIAKMVVPNSTIKKSLQTVPELKDLYDKNSETKRLLDAAISLEGLSRHPSTHAAGVVICHEPLTNFVPLQKTGNEIVTQYEMKCLEEIGLLKMDFLGLRTLTILAKTIDLVKKTRNISLDLDSLPLDDEKSYKLLQSAQTIGVFQVESKGFAELVKNLHPENFFDMIPLVALYRPGPLGSGMVDDFIKRRKGLIKIKHLHPLLEPVLKETYGVILYQDQVMQIASVLAGFSLGQGDLLARAMGKKNLEKMAQQKDSFLKGASERGIDEITAREIFDLMAYFAGYGFNKAHSAAYAVIVYYTAYMKANFPVEFMAVSLTCAVGNVARITQLLQECRQMGIEILPPDINRSFVDFTVENNAIRFGLNAIKNAGTGAMQSILQIREDSEFKSISDFCSRLDSRLVNKKVVESLVKSGAFDNLGINRKTALHNLEKIISLAESLHKDRVCGQMSFFEMAEEEPLTYDIEEQEEFAKNELLAMEKEVLGLYVSEHPITGIMPKIEEYGLLTGNQLFNLKEGDSVGVAGLVSSIKKILTKNNQTMAFVQLEDMFGSFELIIFPKVYEKYKDLVEEDKIIVVEGKVNLNEKQQNGKDNGEEETEEQAKLIAEKIYSFDNYNGKTKKNKGVNKKETPVVKETAAKEKETSKKLYITISANNMPSIQKVKDILTSNHGKTPVCLSLIQNGKNTIIALSPSYWVKDSDSVTEQIEELLGKGNLEITSAA